MLLGNKTHLGVLKSFFQMTELKIRFQPATFWRSPIHRKGDIFIASRKNQLYMAILVIGKAYVAVDNNGFHVALG